MKILNKLMELSDATQPEKEQAQISQKEHAKIRSSLLPKVRSLLLKEFQFNKGKKEIENQLGQEPYNMITKRNGERYTSTQWKSTIEQIWAINNVTPVKGRYLFDDCLKYKDYNYSRRQIYAEPIFRADLTKLLKDQFRELGYPDVFTNVITKYYHYDVEPYQTVLVKVKVYKN